MSTTAPTVTRVTSTIPRLSRGDELTPEYLTDEAQAMFEAMWRGDLGGFTESRVRASLAEHEQDLALVRAGRKSPRKVLGPYVEGKGIKAEAVRVLEVFIAEAREDIETRGQSNTVNRANVRYHLIRS